jgi:hypothetical protein
VKRSELAFFGAVVGVDASSVDPTVLELIDEQLDDQLVQQLREGDRLNAFRATDLSSKSLDECLLFDRP